MVDERGNGRFGSRCANHDLTCCSNGGGRKAGWQTRVRHGNNDENLTVVRSHEGKKLTSLVKVSVKVEDDLSFRVRSLRVGLSGRRGGRDSWD